MANQPAAPALVVPLAPNTNESSETPPSEERQQRELDQAQRYGELLESYRQVQAELQALKLQVESGQASMSELSALRSELAGLRTQMEALTRAPEEPAGDGVVLVTPEPEPIEDEPPPPPPKKSWLETILGV